MDVQTTELAGVLIFVPQVHRDKRGFFTRTFDADVSVEHGVDAASFRQDSQSRSGRGMIRGMHSRSGEGEAKLVRCAHGAVLDVVVDIRPLSTTFGQHVCVRLDDVDFAHLYVPPGFLHGFQVLSETADVCYRIDRPHDPDADLAVHYADPTLAINWPLPVSLISERDDAAGAFTDLPVHL